MPPFPKSYLYCLLVAHIVFNILPVVLLPVGELFIWMSYINTGVILLTLSFFLSICSIMMLRNSLCLYVYTSVIMAYLFGLYMRPFIRGPALITTAIMAHLFVGVFMTLFKK